MSDVRQSKITRGVVLAGLGEERLKKQRKNPTKNIRDVPEPNLNVLAGTDRPEPGVKVLLYAFELHFVVGR